MITHCFTKHPGGILSTKGVVHPEVFEAIERGILLDVGYGEHFSYTTAEKVLDQGVVPHLISSDVHAPFGSPHSIEVEYGLNEAMSRMFPLGFTLEQLIQMVTSRPAKVLGLESEIGHLKVGREADITVFELESGHFPYRDTEGLTKVSDKRLFSRICIKSGEVFDLRKDKIVVAGM
jgi:dihydroorotase